MSAERRCRVCGGAVCPAFRAREMMLGTREGFDYEECLDCGGLQIARIPEDLDRYYGPDYYTASRRSRPRSAPGAGVLRRGWSRLRASSPLWPRALSGRRYAHFEWFRRTGTRVDDPILDVGCGSGRLLHRLSREGFSRLTGIDPRAPSEASEGSEAPGPRFARETPEQHVGQYRLVMSHHSFEHMRDPVSAFEAMARLVEPGGSLLLRVPVADGWARAHYAQDWAQLDAPRHLQLPTRRSIEGLASRFGLRLVHCEDDSGPFQIWGSELYRRDVPLVQAGPGGRQALSLFERGRARWQARRLRRAGRGDQACFYLRKDAAPRGEAPVAA